MEYEWQKDLAPYTSHTNVEKLRQLVNDKIGKGQAAKWLIIIGDILFVGLIILLIGFFNVLQIKTDPRIGLINGIIAFELAVVAFLSPIKTNTITKKEVDGIVGREVIGDVMRKIHKTVEQKTSGIQKWLALIGACGVFTALILKLIS